MSQLFNVGVPAISKHLKNIFNEGELDSDVVVSKMEITTRHGAIEGKTQTNEVDFYNLDAIIAVGYRVSSMKATRFRQWATSVLNSYIRKGFALDDARLKELGGGGYWKELLLRIRDIRWECLPYRNHLASLRWSRLLIVAASSRNHVLPGRQYLSNLWAKPQVASI